MTRRACSTLPLALASILSLAGCFGGETRLPRDRGYLRWVDEDTGIEVHEMRVGVGTAQELAVRIAPELGANPYSLRIGDTELLRQAPTLSDVRGMGFGIPILYPTPNRVRNATFEFEGRKFELPANAEPHHIHGFVHSQPWEPGEVEVTPRGLRMPLVLDIGPSHPIYAIFPFDHRLEVAYTLTPDGLDVAFDIKNRDTRRLPFGLAIHPYFRILGERSETYVEVPGRGIMEKNRFTRMPSGQVRELDGSETDLRKARALSELDLDDVYVGMVPERPARWVSKDAGVEVTLEASDIFTHAVVYTPSEQDFFCLENQTCSTDAHNLYAQGFTDAAHLLILEPVAGAGSRAEGRVSIRVRRTEPAAPTSETDPDATGDVAAR